MYGELYQYLVFHKKLNLPGIGTFQLERKPAEFDHAARMVHPSSYSIVLHHGNVSPSAKFFNWLAIALNRTEEDTVNYFNAFVIKVKDEVLAGNKLNWANVGTLSKGLTGEIRFESAIKSFTTDLPVPAIKILREQAEHMVRVGEEEKTSVQMKELLNPGREQKPAWWIAAMVLALIILLFCGIYFSQQGMKTSSVGNQQKIDAARQTSTYQLLQ